MSKGRVLAIAPNTERLHALLPSLERAGAEVDAVSEPGSIAHSLLPHKYIFCSLDAETEVEVLLPRTRARTQIAVIIPNASLEALMALLGDSRINHVLVGDEANPAVFTTVRKLLSGDIFGIEKYLPEGTNVNYIRLRDSHGRGAAIDTLLRHAEAEGIRKPVRSAVAQVCEELLMNALYDAPADELGNPLFATVDPHDRREAKSPRPVSIRYAVTESQFLIAVRDRFGRLAKDTIIAYMNKCLHSAEQIDRKTYGAGLGLYLVANAAAGYVVNVAHGIATEVICMFDRAARSPLRLVGVFVHPGSNVTQTSGVRKPEDN